MHAKYPLFLPLLCGFLLSSIPCMGETVKDREGALRSDKAKMEKGDRWVYNDVPQGFLEAKKRGKPLMVVLRCVPCLACMGMDASVLLENSRLSPLLDEFVRVRLINANALDLRKFQFDYDLSFSVLFFNGDGTLYGRFGSWEHQKNPQDKTTASLENAGLKGKFRDELDWSGQVVKSCVHCHQIEDSLRLEQRDKGRTFSQAMVFPYPAPETIGMEVESSYPLRLKSLVPGSPVHRTGLRPGDLVLGAGGQPVISSADLSWVLHHFPDTGGKLELFARRGTRTAVVQAELPSGWRLKSDVSRRVGTWGMRGMAFGGIKFTALGDAEKRSLGLDGGDLALRAEHVGKYNQHAAAHRVGWKKGDVLVGLEGVRSGVSESELMGLILQRHSPGKKLSARVLRGGKEMNLKLPVQ